MTIIERGRALLDQLRGLAHRTAWEWRRCPHCGGTQTQRWGSYPRHPWTLAGRQTVAVQRHWCLVCQRSYAEQSALWVRGSWYARDVHRCALDLHQHGGSSLRRAAEWRRSLVAKQERWRRWRPLDPTPPDADQCHLSASTVYRWADRAGQQAQASVAGQLAGVPTSGQFGTDGLGAKLKGGAVRVVLLLTDSVTGGRSTATPFRRWWWRESGRRRTGRRCLTRQRWQAWTRTRCAAAPAMAPWG